ncbi:MAG: cobalamin B12-binding domain-containing protein [Anaerolineales bacterium]|nr:MAG: cobalamin B12-binding domain-containing protein [Anaerolineales bacterium]
MRKDLQRTVVAGALGECVHVAGVINFLRLAESAGWRTVFLGPAVPVDKFVEVIREENPDLVGVSYRLTPETGERLLAEFAEQVDGFREQGVRFAFGGTPPIAERAVAIGFFERVFDGNQASYEVLAYLKGSAEGGRVEQEYPQTLVDRIRWKSPYPIFRHHFGLPTLDATIKGVETIAQAGALDVISLGTDQDAQEYFFSPEHQKPRARGAGGVPVRTPEDFRAIYKASRCGNFPLMRTYSGTDDFIQLAEMFVETINNAWCAIPIFWFNRMDGRGPWDLQGSIHEHQKLMTWYGDRGIPVELNEPHHWGMRDAADVIFVVSAYLSAYNARAFGVRDYIAQLMFNSPPGISDAMDLAKMLACLKMIAHLEDANFRVWRQTRTGLLSYPLDPSAAHAHLAASIYLQMALDPHILHIVGHTEALHAALPEDVIDASKAAQRVVDNAINGAPDMAADSQVQERLDELCREAKVTLDAIRSLLATKDTDPLLDPETLALAVRKGILDAPHLVNNEYAPARMMTQVDERGACVAIDPHSGNELSEEERIASLL